ncbi:MAG TPA: hypothetical protein VJW20_23515 [Candidatus Angelobacter sp.]|nr:hypothetical protein [Candidatus Angelobacter sp.]
MLTFAPVAVQAATTFSLGQLLACSTNPNMKGENVMNDSNRVLIRRGARELTETETEIINGGFITFSRCTNHPSPDGDQHVGEMGC